MASIQIVLPAMGEGIIEATITQILKSVGASVEQDETIFEIATDKVDSEITAPESGVITEILVQEGDVVKIGSLLAMLQTEGEEEDTNQMAAVIEIPKIESIIHQHSINKDVVPELVEKVETFSSDRFLSPLVRNILKQEKISASELETIKGTGLNERVTKDDVLVFLQNRTQKNGFAKPTESVHVNTLSKSENNLNKTELSVPKANETKIVSTTEDELIEMDRMRKLIAEHMVHSIQTAPHVTSFVEADLTPIVNWRNKYKDAFEKREGEKLTFMPIIVEAMTKAIKDFPMINVSVVDQKILKRKRINIGMAAALPSGNLIVPVIKNADEKNLVGLAKTINDLAARARNNKLQPDEIQGSTITITNLGTFGNIAGTPIINQPNVAILAVGAIVKKPAVIETPEGDTIGIRHKMILSLAYDHRVVDGALGGLFLKRVADYLEQFDTNRPG